MLVSKDKVAGLFRKSFFAIIFFIVFCLIYVLFPKQGTFKYEFQKGSPWRHESLIAPFDFPIMKPKEVVDAEKDSIRKNFIPFFTLDRNVENKQIESLDHDILTAVKSGQLKGKEIEINVYRKVLKDVFANLYGRGILENSPEMYEPLNGKNNIFVVTDNLAVKTNVTDILSLKSAYLILDKKLKETAVKNQVSLRSQQIINFDKYIEPNLFYDQKTSDANLAELLGAVSVTRGAVQAGERIISEGDIVNSNNFILLQSLKQAYKKNSMYGGWISSMIIGQMLLILGLLTVLVLYLRTFNNNLFLKKRNFALIFSLILITFLLARLLYDTKSISLYIIPVCILPIIIRIFMGARMSIFIHLITILMIGFLAPNSFEFVFIQVIAGIVAVISLNKLHRRGHLVLTAIYVTITYLILFTGFGLIKEGGFRLIEWTNMKWFVINGFLLLIAYPLIFIFEKIFRLVSDVTLMELSDTNHPLLRRMSEEAPGSFQHSMQVANLAEEVIVKIGGNAMLVRTGALYHDVGKIINSQYFIENQVAGQNPHENLTRVESAEIIINHVNEGVILARKYKLPEIIFDFIKTHHGKSIAKYFYLKYKEENPGIEVDVSKFHYPGPNPSSRETAVVMLADVIEATTRSLPEKNEDSVKKVINQIIDQKLQDHELDDTALTFKEISDIKEIFLRKLMNIYHIRIQYPTEEKNS